MRLILHLLIICVLAAGVGLGLTELAVRNPPALDVIEDGPWRAVPREGAPDIDAYALAGLATRAEVPLAVSEGLSFRAKADSDGQTLNGRCSYLVSGAIPAVRVWSLAAFDPEGRTFPNASARFAYSSAEATRTEANSVNIHLSTEARHGDWLPIGQSDVVLVLRLYDTTAGAISGGRSAPDLPSIRRQECR